MIEPPPFVSRRCRARSLRALAAPHRSRCPAARAFEPIEDDASDGVAVVFQHQHVTVADNTAVGEKAEVGLGAVGVEPVDDGAVDLTRVVEIVRTGDDEHALAGELARVVHAHLVAVDVLPLEQDRGRDRGEAGDVA
jgi:hypothetical protein